MSLCSPAKCGVRFRRVKDRLRQVLLIFQRKADVRSGVVFGLTGYEIPDAVGGLISLSSDSNEDIRDWSTFGIGRMITLDTPAIRAALYARLDDPCIEARNEAIEGLATRFDEAVLPVLIRELHDQVSIPLLEAAIALARPELCEALVAAKTGGLVVQTRHGFYDLSETWEKAMKACECQGPEAFEPAIA